jgi:SAM-dependent methyltransferase
MRRALFWYHVLVVGGFILLIRSAGWLGHELRCIVAGKKEDRLFPFTRPTVAILALVGTGCFGVVLYILNVTLALPALMLITHLTSKTVLKLAVPWRHQAGQKQSGTPVVKKNWHYYDGILYETVVEPLAREMRCATVAHVPAGSRTIDICCGTGGLALHLAEKCGSVTGIDHALGMIDYARNQQHKRGLKNVTFAHADAQFLPDFEDRAFDCAVLSMALHEMPRASGVQVLKEAARVAREIIIVDYAVPLPTHMQGLVFLYLEVVAGLSHLKGFLNYSQHKGLDALVEDAALVIKSDTTAVRECIRIVEAARDERREQRMTTRRS